MTAPLPVLATWRHVGATDGFEVLAPRTTDDGGLVLAGHTTGVEEGTAYALGYRIEVDRLGRTRKAEVQAWWPHGTGSTLVVADGRGTWMVDGSPRPRDRAVEDDVAPAPRHVTDDGRPHLVPRRSCDR